MICLISLIILSWICKLISSSMFCNSSTWFLMIISKILQILHSVSLFYFDLIFLIMSSLIFFVAVILSIICKLVIYFFSIFLFVLNFNVCTTLLSYLICPIIWILSSHPSFFFSRAIYPFFLRISRTFSAFCYSIYIMALLSWILSLKFSKICYLMDLISSF